MSGIDLLTTALVAFVVTLASIPFAALSRRQAEPEELRVHRFTRDSRRAHSRGPGIRSR